MKLKSSIVAILALSSISFAGGDIGGATTFETGDTAAAEVEAVEPAVTEPVVTEPAVTEPIVAPAKTEIKNPEPPKPQVEKKVEAPVATGKSGLYVGIAASSMGVRADDRVNLFSSEEYQDIQKGITLLVGYDIIDYLSVEARGAFSLAGENTNQDNLQEYGIYLKPKYPILDKLNIYGILGYSAINMSDPKIYPPSKFDGDNSGFSFGGGIDFGITENISVFTDYVNYLRDFGGSNSTWGANLGLIYKFD